MSMISDKEVRASLRSLGVRVAQTSRGLHYGFGGMVQPVDGECARAFVECIESDTGKRPTSQQVLSATAKMLKGKRSFFGDSK